MILTEVFPLVKVFYFLNNFLSCVWVNQKYMRVGNNSVVCNIFVTIKTCAVEIIPLHIIFL